MDLISKSIFNSLLNKYSVESYDSILEWIKTSNEKVNIKLSKRELVLLDKWIYSPEKIYHESNKFFSIEGLRIKGNYGSEILDWDQPIINQPEFGYLGIISKEFNGVLHFLLQAKIEPGNVNKVQISPTIQATKSNFSKVHLGKTPDYFENFQNCNLEMTLVDQLQTEQGARFLQKRNRNIIIYDKNAEALDDRFKWINLYQLKKMMLENNIVNMDTRTVIGCLRFIYPIKGFNYLELSNDNINQVGYSYIFNQSVIFPNDYVYFWLTRKKNSCDVIVEKIHLTELRNWICTLNSISNVNKKFFNVIGVDVSIENREVINWSQPMIEPVEKGQIALLFSKYNDNLYFLVRAKFEIGSFDKVEFAPSIQTSKSNLGKADRFIYDLISNATSKISVYQSEEGGRFFHEENLNELYEIEYFEIDLNDSDFVWLSYSQIQHFMKTSGIVNIQLRTMLSMMTENLLK